MAQTGFTNINGAQLYYEVTGSGHPLVMVHAGIADCRMWDDQFEIFAERYRVIRYDMRGYGRSVPVAGSFSHHADLYALLKFLDVEHAYVMGCSMGGRVCINMALQQPEMVTALIPIGSGVAGFTFAAPPPRQRDALEAALKQGDLERASELEVQIWVDGASRTPDQVNARVRERVREMNLAALKNEALELGDEQPLNPPAIQRLGELRMPTLIMVGELDMPRILAASDALAAQIAGAKKSIISGAAHVPNMERPAEFNRIVLDFLSKI